MNRNSTGTSVQEAYEKFIRLKKLKKLSPESISYYDNGFRYFGEFFDTARPCSDINKDTIYAYLEHLQTTRNANDVTINTYLKALRTILYYFMEEGYMQSFKIELVKVEKEIKETYTEEELERLLRKPDVKKCGFSEYRSWVLTNYLLGTGNRIRTALNVKIEHLDFANQLILLGKTKNGRQQLIPMSDHLSVILQEYLLYRKGEPGDYLFCSIHGSQLTRDGVTTVMYRYNKNRGVEKTSVHVYRHTFAKWWILNGGDIFRLQKLLGHRSVEMVRNYVEMFNSDLSKNFTEFNPLDKFAKERQGELIHMKK
jgi:integrase/recombinase XerD